MGRDKSFDQVIDDLRRGQTGGVGVGRDGRLILPQDGKSGSAAATADGEAPTETRPVVWGAWWEEPQKRRLFELERQVMAERFPDFELAQSQTKPGMPAWRGALRPLGDRTFDVELVHRPSYPHAEPLVWVLSPRLRSGSPHVWPNDAEHLGAICLHVGQWKPFRSTAVASVASASEWLALYEVFLRTGERW